MQAFGAWICSMAQTVGAISTMWVVFVVAPWAMFQPKKTNGIWAS